MRHECEVPHCDGTSLGHDLAVEFPAETKRVDEALDRLRNRVANPTETEPEEGQQ